MKYAPQLLLVLLSISGRHFVVDVPTIDTNYAFQCLNLSDTVFKPETLHQEHNRSIFIQVEEHDALQQTVSRIYAIVLRQVFKFTDITLMQTINEPNATMTEENRIDRQLQAMSNKVADVTFSSVFNVGIHHPVAYPYVTRAVNIKYTGPLGPNTRYAWFLPTRNDSLRTGNDSLPDGLLPIDTFESLHFDRVAKFFHVHMDILLHELGVELESCETYKPTYCTKQQTCAIMLAGNRTETAFITEHIRILNVRVQMLWLGDQLLLHVDKLRQVIDPPLFLLLARTPSEIVRRNSSSFRSVAMPTFGGQLTPMQAGVYDLTPMAKYSSNNLLLQYIDALHFDGAEDLLLEEMANQITRQPETKLERCQIYEQVACDWLKNITKITDEKQKHDYLEMLSINKWNLNTTAIVGGIFPAGPMFDGLKYAADMAVGAINQAPDLLPGMRLILNVADRTERPLLSFIKMSMHKKMLGVIGPDIKGITYIAEPARTPIMFYSSDGGNMDSEISEHDPYCFRTIGDRQQFISVYDALFRQFGWHRVGLLSDGNPTHVQYHLQLAANLKNSSFEVETLQLQQNASVEQIRVALGSLKAMNMRIIMTELSSDVADQVMCQAFHLGMTAHQDYAWFLPSDLAIVNRSAHTNASHQCSADELSNAYDGHLSLYAAPFANKSAALRPDAPWTTVDTWQRFFRSRPDQSGLEFDDQPSYAGFVYDAVWLYALALNYTISTSTQELFKLRSIDTSARLVVALANSNLTDGVSGHVRFNDIRSSRVSDIYVGQRYNLNGSSNWRLVYKFLPNQAAGNNAAGRLVRVLADGLRMWPNSDAPISDGTPICHLQPLNVWLGLGCSTTMAIFYTSCAAACMCALLGGMYAFWERRYRMRLEREAQMLRSFGIDLVSRQVDETRLDKSEIARNRIVLNRRLGGGQFGTVYFGQLRNEQDRCEQVAIKTPENPNNFNIRLEFLSEAQAMRRFDHPNIVRLIGVSLLADPMYIVMEYMILGDLNMYLLSRRQHVTADTHAQWSRRLTGIVLDLARGLAYMADLKYVHRDIACRNCLLTGAGEHVTAKLADFGMSRPVYANDVYRFRRRGALPVRWSAPESMQTGTYSPSTDVWSFGVLMWEIVTLGAYPYHEVHDDQVLLALIRSGRTLTIPPEVNEDLRWLITECWHLNAKMRVRACEIVDFVGGRATLVEPCVLTDDDKKFAQIYEMNNEPGKKGKGLLQQLEKPAAQADVVGSEMASVQTLHNDLTTADRRVHGNGSVGGQEHVFNNCNYASGVMSPEVTDANADDVMEALQRLTNEPARDVSAVERPLLQRWRNGTTTADWRWPNWTKDLRFWRHRNSRRRGRRAGGAEMDQVNL